MAQQIQRGIIGRLLVIPLSVPVTRDRLKARLTAGDGHSQGVGSVDVNLKSEGQYELQVTATVAGDHILHIYVDDKEMVTQRVHIDEKPILTLSVPPVTRTVVGTAMTWELKGNVEGQPVRAEFRGPRGQTVSAHVDRAADELHVISLVPTEAGPYKGSLSVGDKTVQSLELEASETAPKVQFHTRASDMHAHIDVSYSLPFTLVGISLNNLRVTVTNPSGGTVPSDLQRGTSADKAALVFTPTAPGDHRVLVTLDGQQVSQPMIVHVHAYSELRWAETPSISTVGATVTFNFELYRIQGETIEGHLTSNSGAVTKARAVPLGNNRYSVSFTPLKSDRYTLQIVIDTHNLPPERELKVVEHAAAFASGNAREGRVNTAFVLKVSLSSSAGTNARVKAHVRDADTVLRRLTHSPTLSHSPPSLSKNSIVGEGEVTPTSDGVSVKWTPKRPGRYTLSLEVDGVPLPTSEVSLFVPPSRQCKVLRNTDLILGQDVTFTVSIDSDTPTHSVTGKVTVNSNSTGAQTVLPLRSSRNGDGTWDLTFTVPNEAKGFNIELTADGHWTIESTSSSSKLH